MYERDGIYNPEIDQIDQDIRMMQDHRNKLLKEAEVPKLPPQEQTLVVLAHEAGEMGALYRTERERRERAVTKIDKLQEIADRVPGLERESKYWREEAERLETTLKRSRAARKK